MRDELYDGDARCGYARGGSRHGTSALSALPIGIVRAQSRMRSPPMGLDHARIVAYGTRHHVRQRPRVRYHSSAHATLPSWVVEVVTMPMRILHTTTIGAAAARRTTRARSIRGGRRNSRGDRGAQPSWCSDVGGSSEGALRCAMSCTIATRVVAMRAVVRSTAPSRSPRFRLASYARSRARAHLLWDSSPQPSD